MKSNNLLPLVRTGWFYLLVVSAVAIGWLISSTQLSHFNQWNREVLYQLMPANSYSSKIVRLNLGAEGLLLDKTKDVLKQFPNSYKVLVNPEVSLIESLKKQERLSEVGNDSLERNSVDGKEAIDGEAAIDGKGDLSQSKRQQTPASESLASLLENVIVASDKNATEDGLFSGDRQLDWFDFGWRRLVSERSIAWVASDRFVYSPILISGDAISTVWREGDSVYPGVTSWVIKSLTNVDRLSLQKSLNLSVVTDSKKWAVGFNGKVYSGGEGLKQVTLGELETIQTIPQIIVIDFSLGEKNQRLSTTIARIEQGNYLTSSFQALAILLALSLVALLVVWKIAGRILYQQVIGIVAVVASLLLIQYLLFTQLVWMPVIPTLLLLLPIVIFLNAYQWELKLFEKQQSTTRRLVGESAKYYYQAREFEKLQPWLQQISADKQLSETLFDLGLQAESENNKTLAVKLFEWVNKSGVEHSGVKQKLEEYTEAEQQEDEDLGSTMVIQPGQSSPGTVSNPALQIENFGRYKVEGVLGKGAMGIVFQGVDPKINRHVAIKTLQLSGDESDENFADMKSRFFREAETAGNLSHANIVTIYDVGEEGELGYIAMDLLTGAPLSRFLKTEQLLPSPLVYQLMIQITDALDYAHKQNVVHRDIKPANIIYDDEIQRVTITDFGIACVTDQSKTRTGTIMGSPFYMSPEQVLGQRVDGRSDIFSLGVTFYQLLSGHLPFNGESIASVAFHITKTKHESVRNWVSKLPASAVRITNKALQKDPQKRYQTMAEFKQALIAALKRDYKKAPIV